MVEVPVFVVTEWAVLKYLKILKGSILIHLFACYFGLGVTFALYRPCLKEGHSKENTSYQSDILRLMGTLFLWVFWPSFNSALTLKGDEQHRAILHTFIGLSASTLMAFALSAILNKNGKLTMGDVQNVTLASVGASVDMMISCGRVRPGYNGLHCMHAGIQIHEPLSGQTPLDPDKGSMQDT